MSEPQRDRDGRLVAVTSAGTGAVTSTCRASTSACAVNACSQGAGVGVDQRPLARGGSAARGRPRRDPVCSRPTTSTRTPDVGRPPRWSSPRAVSAGVGAVGEHQQLALARRCRPCRGPAGRRRRAGSAGRARGPSTTSRASSRSRLGARASVDVAVEGDDADVDVLGHGVEEGERGGLRGLEPLAGHRVAGVHDQDRGALRPRSWSRPGPPSASVSAPSTVTARRRGRRRVGRDLTRICRPSSVGSTWRCWPRRPVSWRRREPATAREAGRQRERRAGARIRAGP